MQEPRVLIACLLTFAMSASAADKKTRIVVEAGDFDRRDVIAEFTLPMSVQYDRFSLRREGKQVPFQVGPGRKAAFVIPQLKKGQRVIYQLSDGERGAPWAQGGVLNQPILDDEGKLRFTFYEMASSLGSTLIAYQTVPGAFPREDIKPAFRRGGYLHPIHTLSGKLVTDDFPPNHIHHHGVWWAWTNTEFDGRKPDFWNVGDGKGRVEFDYLNSTWNGPVHSGFNASHRFMDLTAPKSVQALNDWWEVKVYVPQGVSPAFWMFDLVSEQRCATTNALKLPEYRYGGIGVRGNWAWNGKDKAMFLTSEGETDREKGNTTRGRWCDMGGLVEGSRVGIAILCHPDNFRAPQPMRIHPTEPFFNFAPQQAGDMEIKPGDKYVSRYRFVVHDGPPDKAELDRLWNDYAHPPVVRVEAK